MLVFHFRLFEILIPKNFTQDIYFISRLLKTVLGFTKLQVPLKWKNTDFVLSALMIRLLFENQVSNCFMTLFNLSCIASIFLSIISILISSAKRTNFASWIIKGKSFTYNKHKRGPQNWSLRETVFYFLARRFIYLLVLCYQF